MITESDGPQSTLADRCLQVALQIAGMIQKQGIDTFRLAVRQVVMQRAQIDVELLRREEARLQALKANGVLYVDGAIPDKPAGEWIFHLGVIRGWCKFTAKGKKLNRPEAPKCILERKNEVDWSTAEKREVSRFHTAQAKFEQMVQVAFDEIRQLGFPNDANGDWSYAFDVGGWIQKELDHDQDPRNEPLLPVPSRALTNDEKLTILAAIHDAHNRGSEKVAPWGWSDNDIAPEIWPGKAEPNDRHVAFGYHALFRAARQVTEYDLVVIESWLLEAPNGSPKKLRVELHADTKVIQIDGKPHPLVGSETVKERLVSFIQALIDARGAPVAAKDYEIRTRDIEQQDMAVKSLIADDAKPGSGHRIPLEKLMA